MRKAWWRPGFTSGPSPEKTAEAGAAEAAAALVTEAVRALTRDDAETFRRLADEIAGLPDAAGWRRAADRALFEGLQAGVTAAWDRGWQPADVVRFTVRRYGARHRRLVIDAIAAEMRAYPAATVDDTWHEQLAGLGAKVWWDQDDEHLDGWRAREGLDRVALVVCAAELIKLLAALPLLAGIGPRPGEAAGGGRADGDAAGGDTGRGSRAGAPSGSRASEPAPDVDQRMLGKVRALLAKAESTEFPEEAEALSARAQELMARHSIGHALLAAESGTAHEPVGRRIAVDNPYDAPKAVLLTVVAEANRCRAVWHRELGFSTVLGFPADLTAVEMLFTSLLVQATSAMVHAGPQRDARGRSRTRSFRHAFLNAYAARVGERLREAANEAANEAAAGADGKDLLPVLAARDRAVEQAVDTLFPNLARGRAGSVSNYEGWVAGRVAADLASLNGRSEVTGAFRRR